MPRIFKDLEAVCLQVNLLQVNLISTSAEINQLKYTILLLAIYAQFALRILPLPAK